jgi:hypothetical protein
MKNDNRHENRVYFGDLPVRSLHVFMDILFSLLITAKDNIEQRL